MIKISHLNKSYYKQKIIDDLSLAVKRGTVFGFLGPNGAGKTTTMKMLVGLNMPDSGEIRINKLDPASTIARQQIGFMPENPYFYDHLTGYELLKFCYGLSTSALPSSQYHLSSPRRRGSTNVDSRFHGNDRGEYDRILTDVGLLEAKNKMIREYSKGMKQRLGLAQAIIHNPDYIFLDEPLDGLDPIGRIEIKKIIKGLKKQGKTVFFNSHILADVEEICDEIGIINKGKLIYHGSVKKFSNGKSLENSFVELIQKSNIKVQNDK